MLGRRYPRAATGYSCRRCRFLAPTILGNVIKIVSPTVNLLPGSNQAAVEGDTQQEIVQLFTFNVFGQMIRTVDPEKNVDLYEYHPERDPNGDGVIDNPTGDATTGGYLKQVTRDAVSDPDRNSGTNPTPAAIRNMYLYDAVGNTTRAINGRGIATDYVYNQLNEVVQVTSAAAHGLYGADPNEPLLLTDFQYIDRYFRDFNGNMVLSQTEDRGNTSNVDGNLPALPNVPGAANADPVGGTAFVDTVFMFDILDNAIATVQEVGGSLEGDAGCGEPAAELRQAAGGFGQ